MIQFTLNGKPAVIDADPEMPLLWAIRESASLTGTKFGCGAGQCGACTVHLGGAPVRSCSVPLSSVAGMSVTTIEGISGTVARSVQTAWRSLDVVQCGYCQSGQIMSAVALLSRKPKPTDDEITVAMNGNICRCATYGRVRAAIHAASKAMEG